MEITNVDPLQFDLLFERFLNPERVSFPDVDVDFCTRRRGEVIQYVTEKYGREQVAQIITFGSLATRAAIKDVGRALDLTFGEVEKLTKLVPNTLNIKLKDAMAQEPGFAEAAKADPRVKEVLGRLLEDRRPGAQRRHARRRGGDLAGGAAGTGSAVQDEPG